MKTNKHVRDNIFEIIENQLRDDDPRETRITFARLLNEGFSEFQTKQLIGQCITLEFFKILKHNEEYNNERYIRNLLNLPKEPVE